MTSTPSLLINQVITDWDMRVKHELRKLALAKLGTGQCIVALNRSRNIALVLDHIGGVYQVWAESGERFNIDKISEYMAEGIKVRLHGVVKYRKTLEIAA